jgi:hypothetical protein
MGRAHVAGSPVAGAALEIPMTMQRVDKAGWAGFCDMLTAELLRKRAEIETSLPGAQPRWLPLVGVTYDPGSEVMEIVLRGTDHMIFHPRELYVERGPRGVESVGIVEGGGACEIVLVREPIAELPRTLIN